MDITVTISEAEAKALSVVATSPSEWIENLVHERARLAIDSIFESEVQRMISDPNITDIPADKEAVVLAYNPPVVPSPMEV